MPLSVQSLTPDSTQDAIDTAKSESIAQCVNEGRPQDQCVAIVMRYIEEATGRPGRGVTTKKATVMQ